MTEELEPLDAELANLFAAEARIPQVPAELRARVAERLPLAAAAPLAATAGWGLGKVALIFALGAATGATLHAVLAPEPAARIVEVEKPAPEPVPIVIPLPLPLEPANEPESVREQKRAAPRNEPSPADVPALAPSALSRERAVLDAARTAIAQGHANDALSALLRHTREFPEGSLVEEREGLWVLALVRAGQPDVARVRAARFRARYPASLFLPAIDRAVSHGP